MGEPIINFAIRPQEIKVGMKYGTYNTVSKEVFINSTKLYGMNTTSSGYSNLSNENYKIEDKLTLRSRNPEMVLINCYSDENKSSILIQNRNGESLTYSGSSRQEGSVERPLSHITSNYIGSDGFFHYEDAEDKNNNGIVDEGEIYGWSF